MRIKRDSFKNSPFKLVTQNGSVTQEDKNKNNHQHVYAFPYLP